MRQNVTECLGFLKVVELEQIHANTGNWKVSILSILEVFHGCSILSHGFSACHQFFPPDLPYFFPLFPWPSPTPTSFIRFHQRMVHHGGGCGTCGTSHGRNLQLLGLGTFNRHCQRFGPSGARECAADSC